MDSDRERERGTGLGDPVLSAATSYNECSEIQITGSLTSRKTMKPGYSCRTCHSLSTNAAGTSIPKNAVQYEGNSQPTMCPHG